MATAKKTAPAPAAKKAARATKTSAAEAAAPVKKAPASAPLKITDRSVPEDKPHLKFPKTLAECADKYAEVMDERLALQKQIDKLAEHEAALKLHIINNLPVSHATGVAGKYALVQVVPKSRIQVTNWDAIIDYAVKNRKKGGFAIFQRRINDATVKEILDKNPKFAGAEAVSYKSLSLSRIGKKAG